MALRLDQFDMLLLWESTTLSNVEDVIAKRAVRGVQLVPFSERVKTYDGKVAIRRLSKAITLAMQKRLVAFRRKVSGRPYERNYIELIKAAYDGPFGENKENLSSLFCSELVAEAYQQMGLLNDPPKGWPANEYTPRDLSTEARQPLRLLKGYSLEKELLITK